MEGNRANPVHESDRRAVGDSGADVSAEATVRWAGTSVARYACGAAWGALDSAYRGTMARTPVEVSALSDLPSAFSILATFRVADPRTAKTGRGFARSRQDRSVGNLHRRQLQFGEKRGSAVGPTRRGKGSKIMAIADRHGLPIACSIASASPHETKLVEATVDQRFTRAKPQRMIGDRAYDSDPLDQR